MQPQVIEIMHAIKRAGGTAWLVGGCVRDIKLGINPKDWDILACGIPRDDLERILPGRVEYVGHSFGVFKVTVQGNEHMVVDVAIPRIERSTGTGHRDFEVSADHTIPVEEDLARRDLTINAIAWDPFTGATVDPFHGLTDIEQGIIRAVGYPEDRFKEDPLRMMRVARFVSKLGFTVDVATRQGIEHRRADLQYISPERLLSEMDGLLRAGLPHVAIEFMVSTGLMEWVIPEMMLSRGFEQGNPYHNRTVLDHVISAMCHGASRHASPRAMWAIMLHDIAKPHTFSTDLAGCGHFYGHEDRGADMVRQILHRLKAPANLIHDVATIVSEHLNPPHDASDKVLRRFTARMGELTDDALMCREADLAAHAPPWPDKAREVIDNYRYRISMLSEIKGFSSAQLALRGGNIIELIQTWRGTPAIGSEIGKIKEYLTQMVINGDIHNDEAQLTDWLTAHWQEVLPHK